MQDDVVRPPFSAIWRQSHATSALFAALAASVPAAAAAAAVMAALDLAAGRPLAATFLSVGRTIRPGAAGGELLVAAALAHVVGAAAWAAVWGLAVAFTAHHLAPLAGAVWGGLFGVAAWLVDFVLILPWLAPTLAASARLALAWHVAYGVTLGALFHVARLRERQRHRATSPRPGSPRGIASPPR